MSEMNHPEEQGRGGIGCWIISIISAFVALGLVVVALFLPPFDLYNRLIGAQYTTLQLQGDAIITPDQTFSFALATDTESEFGARVESISLTDFETANPDAGEWVATARNAVPYYLALQSPVYSIETNGNAPDAVAISMRMPGGGASADVLDLYGWYATASGGRWEFLPSRVANNRIETITTTIPEHVAVFQAAPDVPTILVAYDVSSALDVETASVASIVAPGGLQPMPDGTVTGSLAAGFDPNASYLLMPVIRNYSDPRAIDLPTVEGIIGNSNLRSAHARQLALLTSGNGYDGIVIDYRGLPAEQRDNFSAFIRELGTGLEAVGRSLVVVVPQASNEGGIWQTGAYDWRAIGASADYIQITLGIDPKLYAPGETQYVEALLRWAIGEVDRYKILLGLSSQSVREFAGTYSLIGYDAALAGLGEVQVEAENITSTGTIQPGSVIRARLDGRRALGNVDSSINTPYIDYVDETGNSTARIWITTGSALRFRMDRTLQFALGGVAFEDLLMEGRAADVLQAIGEYSAQIPPIPRSAEWALRWRVVNTGGEVVQEVSTGLDADLVLTLAAPDGNYAINPAVVLIQEDQEQESVRTGAQVALFSPTSTPTPLPTSTPTPIPTATPTLPPVVATNPPAPSGSGGGGNANPVAAGRIAVGSFEYGGHVTSAGSTRAQGAMRSAGMTWMKVQIRYGPGASPEIAAGAINDARAAGFKILIGTVGNPNDLAAGGDGYVQSYANWLGGIAALGADAIEVWNEPNLSREWPEGQISGVAYANMLRLGYQAIKNANGSTMVISGALAPTGAEAAFPGRVVNDDNFLRQFVNAGGLNYTDCIGVHYNEGITPPTQQSDDPRGDSYYTRFLVPMINVYWSITGGLRPLCFTELGYLTPEGYPPLPEFFSWAQNVSVAQQAAWLAQAAAITSQSGRVRLMIVWNVDFTLYAGDPQAGYAMLRPDGSCPACSALSGAR